MRSGGGSNQEDLSLKCPVLTALVYSPLQKWVSAPEALFLISPGPPWVGFHFCEWGMRIKAPQVPSQLETPVTHVPGAPWKACSLSPTKEGNQRLQLGGAGSSMVKEGLADLLTLTQRWSSTPESKFTWARGALDVSTHSPRPVHATVSFRLLK